MTQIYSEAQLRRALEKEQKEKALLEERVERLMKQVRDLKQALDKVHGLHEQHIEFLIRARIRDDGEDDPAPSFTKEELRKLQKFVHPDRHPASMSKEATALAEIMNRVVGEQPRQKRGRRG